MSKELVQVQTTDMMQFSAEQIAQAGELLGCQMDKASCIRALIIQQDTGLSMARGELSIVPFKGKPQVFINRQGYLAYANRQAEYDGFESGVEEVNGRLTAWCKVYRKDRRFPSSVRILYKEFGKTSPVWQQMPEYMLEKTAISLALRQAFPILNGSLTEEEMDAPITIERRPGDIDVTPCQPQSKAPTQEPALHKTEKAANPQQTKPKLIYAEHQVKAVVENMESQGLEVPGPEFFEAAKLSDGNYNGDIIAAEYLRQSRAKRAQQEKAAQVPADHDTAEEENPKQTKPTTEREEAGGGPTCPNCGKPSMTAEESAHLERLAGTKAFEHMLCKECATKWFTVHQEEKKKLEERMPKCTDCGKRVTEEEARRSVSKFGEPVCPDCWIRRYSKKE